MDNFYYVFFFSLFFFFRWDAHAHKSLFKQSVCIWFVLQEKYHIQTHVTFSLVFSTHDMVWINKAMIFLRIASMNKTDTVSSCRSVYVSVLYICVCVSECLNTCEGAVALLVCIDRPCVRHEGRVAICLTANLQRSGEWDQTGGKITPHTPKWETIIPPKVTQTQPRIRIIEQVFCSPPFPLTSPGLPPVSSPKGARRKQSSSFISVSSSSFLLYSFSEHKCVCF